LNQHTHKACIIETNISLTLSFGGLVLGLIDLINRRGFVYRRIVTSVARQIFFEFWDLDFHHIFGPFVRPSSIHSCAGVEI